VSLRALGLVGDGLTLAKNFAPWFGGVALVAALGGVALGAWGGVRWTEARALRAEKALAEFRAELATATGEAERKAAERQAQAAEARAEHDRTITRAVDSIPAKVAAIIAPQFAQIRRDLDDPQWNCLRVPLPGTTLERLSRPGGTAADR
jgi:hypothetical protein